MPKVASRVHLWSPAEKPAFLYFWIQFHESPVVVGALQEATPNSRNPDSKSGMNVSANPPPPSPHMISGFRKERSHQ